MTSEEFRLKHNGGRNGKWINVRGPCHSSIDRSLGVLFDPEEPDGFRVHSLAGDDPDLARQHVRKLLAGIPPEPPPPDNSDERTNRALALWVEAQPATGTLVDTYLSARHCRPSTTPDSLRFHLNCPFGLFKVPAMVALFRDSLTGKPMGVHLTALRDDGSGKRILPDGSNPKRMLGRATGAAIQLRAHGGQLGIAEGIETALSAWLIFDIPTFAVGSSGAVARFPILPDVELTIFADNDPPGLKAAEMCARRRQNDGHATRIRYPELTGVSAGAIIPQ